jgi:hypothetical protein
LHEPRVVHNRRPSHGPARRVAGGGELRLVGRDEQQRIATLALRRAAAREHVGHRVRREALGDSATRVRRRRAKDRQRQDRRFVDPRRIVGRREDAAETATCPCIFAEHLDDRVVDFMVGEGPRAILG